MVVISITRLTRQFVIQNTTNIGFKNFESCEFCIKHFIRAYKIHKRNSYVPKRTRDTHAAASSSYYYYYY